MQRSEQINEGPLDWLQGGLDIAGLIPGVGEAADGMNAVVSLARGNPLESMLSAVSMIPLGGDAVGKGGKIVLKVLNPAMDAIKASKPAVEIIKKIGPEKIAKIKPILSKLKKVVVEQAPKLKEIFKTVKDGDLDTLEQLIDIKIPKVARAKAEEVLGKVKDKLPEQELSAIFDFISNVPLDEKTEIAEALNHNNSLRIAMYDAEYLNEQFVKTGSEIQRIIES